MSDRQLKNVAASVRQRLLNLSRAEGEDYQKVLFRYAIERLLYRLSCSPHAMVTLGMGNSRMKDFYDLYVLARTFEFSGSPLTLAMRSTFERRETPIPAEAPLALTPEFHDDAAKGIQWRSFLSKNQLKDDALGLSEVATELRGFLLPPAKALASARPFHDRWPPGGPWRSRG